MEYAVNLLACIIALAVKRDGLTAALCLHWLATYVLALIFQKSLLPGAFSIVDMTLCVYALMRWTEYGSQRARCVGLISLMSIMFHFGISVNFGNGNWNLYAIATNALFVLQCIIAGGLFNGLVNILNNISPRRRVGSSANNRGRS